MKVQSYLFFDGRCEEALEFYKRTLGAEVTAILRNSDNPSPEHNPPNSDDKILHSAFRVGDTELFASDGMCGGQPKFEGISLSLHVEDVAKAERLFAALSDGGQVQMPMGESFFAERFGMVADKFGVVWMVIKEKKP